MNNIDIFKKCRIIKLVSDNGALVARSPPAAADLRAPSYAPVSLLKFDLFFISCGLEPKTAFFNL